MKLVHHYPETDTDVASIIYEEDGLYYELLVYEDSFDLFVGPDLYYYELSHKTVDATTETARYTDIPDPGLVLLGRLEADPSLIQPFLMEYLL